VSIGNDIQHPLNHATEHRAHAGNDMIQIEISGCMICFLRRQELGRQRRALSASDLLKSLRRGLSNQVIQYQLCVTVITFSRLLKSWATQAQYSMASIFWD